ncbi:putative inhibitor of apoptosis protein [Abalone herpesvirus Victoria/AUS/2009]|uniref:Putative inhibitor of apoptosis protein n=1 Tax=Abalone herpesvirus (isolate Abalone/Australia/Victoria/2009) TaxID=1241371 RepID=K4JV09_ABHV|nr:putative inhibitor of apoptosis protein [Abalone herpesvirus Victoria/AUS/2009]YP_006908708.1 putative inhibitor of apoptosis protein [Abalone herpesvirus Victoria/AUS/2009]UCX56989.1 ORF1 [Haliotid herpesvirus 1]AFU90011.1 putative inhibitor of apoptosis protein [Abalone herpesvirus Victoria/AUS/2009]AFU90068.1 putative inhibitor of apoptosis protein [Abalone herpesvirus Victoria/AUS/2009]UCX57046.1 ORF55 [Haliotid herpesvirus 1]
MKIDKPTSIVESVLEVTQRITPKERPSIGIDVFSSMYVQAVSMSAVNAWHSAGPDEGGYLVLRDKDSPDRKLAEVELPYAKEEDRLESFSPYWNFEPSSEELAKAGFYYTGKSDRVKCFSCALEISEWGGEEGESPMEIHQRETKKEHGLMYDCAFLSVACKTVPDAVDSTTDNGTYAGRLESYGRFEWPKQSHMKPEELAAAGLYYTGRGDRVACHFCGQILRTWERGDVAMIEHARWAENRNCPYLKYTAGNAVRGISRLENPIYN